MDFANLPSPQTALNNLGARPGDNMLDNAHWDCMDAIINQRKKMEYTEAGYTIDRYRLDGTGTLTVTDNGIVITGTGEGCSLHINVEQSQIIPGETYTLSTLVDELDGTGSIAQWSTPKPALTIGINTLTFVANAYSYKGTSVVYNVVGTVKIRATKLEHSPIQTLARKEGDTWVLNDPPPNKALEQLKCQYFDVHHLVPRFGEIAKGQAKGGVAVYCTVHLPVPKMRINPILKYDPAQWILSSQGSVAASLPVSSIEIVPAQSYDDVIKLIVKPTDPSLLSTGDVYALMPNVAAGTFAVFELDANL